MTAFDRKLSIVFGICVITASLFSTGCATKVAQSRPPMEVADLDKFVVDCRLKEQQMAMLQSMRQNRYDAFDARIANISKPWTSLTNPQQYAHNQNISSGQTNWMINQHLMTLRDYCQ